MEITKKGTPQRAITLDVPDGWWIGVPATCDKCGAEATFDKIDSPFIRTEFAGNGLISGVVGQVACVTPGCSSGVLTARYAGTAKAA